MMILKTYTYLTLFSFISLVSFTSIAQVGINTDLVEDSAALKIHGDSLGVLMPRIALNSYTDITTVPNPAEGLLLFNTSSSMEKGYYYWNGSVWEAFITENSTYSTAKYSNTNTSTDVNSFVLAPIFGTEEINQDSSLYNKLNSNTLRVQRAGRYQIALNFHIRTNDDDVQPICRIRINGNYRGAIAGSGHINTSSNHRNTSLHLYETFNLNAGDRITVQMDTDKSNFSSFDTSGTSTFTIVKIR